MKNSSMNSDVANSVENATVARRQTLPTKKRPYHPPRITHYGAMVRIALGGSPGVGDSGSLNTEFPP
jgi:hypothetical protein